MKHGIYLAGPLFSLAQRLFNNELASCLETRGHYVRNPQEFCEGLSQPETIRFECVKQLSQSAMLLLNCDGTQVDDGAAYEAALASVNKLPVIGFRTDFRNAGDNDAQPANLMFKFDEFIDARHITMTGGFPVIQQIDMLSQQIHEKIEL